MLLLFDIDATLIKLKHGVGRGVLREAFLHTYHVDPVDALVGYSFSGRTDRQIVLDISSLLDISQETAERRFPDYQVEMERRMTASIDHSCLDVLDGVSTMLESVATQHDLALVTGNIKRIAFHKLSVGGIDHFFEIGAFGCEHANRSLLPPLAIERFNATFGTRHSPSTSVVIGDAPGDVQCATDNGIATIAVATGEFTTAQLLESGATAALSSFADVRSLLNAIESLPTPMKH